MLKRVLVNLGVLMGALSFCFVLGEIAARVWYTHRGTMMQFDRALGFRTKANLDQTSRVVDAGGTASTAHLTTDANGFRRFGDVNAKRPKILFLGDSMTFARDVSDDQTFYTIIGKQLDAEVFAYGAEGYATLQEYLILDRYFDLIKPDVVVWQFCRNDIIGNTVELESESALNNNGMRRPYWTPEGTIVYACPRFLGPVRGALQSYSNLLYFVFVHIDRIVDARSAKTTVENIIESRGASHAGFQRSVAVTETLMEKARQRCGTAWLLAFDSDAIQPYFDAFKEACAKSGVAFADDVGPAIDAAEHAGTTTKAADGAHWNAEGHRICAETLMCHLEGHGIARRAGS